MAVTQRGSALVAADGASTDKFGGAVAVSSDASVMVVGAMDWDGPFYTNDGGVYTYDWSGSAWVARGAVLKPIDAAAGDNFGSAVALSGSGTVMAVGAMNWEGTFSNQGGVYIYDASGSTWARRGATLVAADGASGDNFGAALALSGDGTVLVVGATSKSGGGSVYGALYTYDWTGSAWVQRGSVLFAPDSNGLNQPFATGLALSADGNVMAVGAPLHDASGLQTGGVYIFDRSGSAWVLRGSVLFAADATLNDYFGWSVALSGDGTTLAVGANTWEGTFSNQGGVYLYDWNAGGSEWVWRDNTVIVASDAAANYNYGSGLALSDDATVMVVGSSAAAIGKGAVYVYDVSAPPIFSSDIVIPTSLTVSYSSGSISIPTRLNVSATGTISVPTILAVLAAGHVPQWSARCIIGGVDVSATITGIATVRAEEGAARIAELAIIPPSGAFSPLDYVGKTITLDYLLIVSGVEVPQRLFTGLIDTPAYDPNSVILRLSCVDDLQNRVASLPRSVIDGLVGGRYSAAVQGEIDDNWDYAQARLATVAASLDAGPAGGMRVTPWELTDVWATYDDSTLLYERASLTLPQRSTLINQVDVEFEYRYPRLRQRYTTLGWSGTQIDMAPCGYQYPTQQDILSAANGTGWTVTLGVFYPAPAAIPHSSGGFIYPADGSIDLAILHLTQRHSQTITETYTLTITAPESIALNGLLPHALRGALASEFDGQAWESALDLVPLMPTGGEQDYAPDAPRADADYAIETLLDQARVKILGSHRSARCGNAVVCSPELDLDKRVSISTTAITASGKVASVVHTLDFTNGSAITEFEIALFGVGGAGIITPDTLAPPAPPTPSVATHNWLGNIPPLFVHTYGGTPYTDNIMGLLLNPPENITVDEVPVWVPDPPAHWEYVTQSFPNPSYTPGSYPVTGFRVQMPGVADADRNAVEKPVAATYSIIIPTDTVTYTIP